MTDRSNSTLFKEFFAGCVAGFSKIYTGQPFDIVKVRIQNAPADSKPSPLTVLTNIIKNEGGPLALWKGSLPPLLGVGATASIQFGVNENVKKIILQRNGGAKMTFKESLIAGGIAGFANCIVSTPAEHFRIRIQTQSKDRPIYKGSVDCMKKIYSSYGMKGCYKGVVPTIFRDSIGYGVYFAVYAKLLDWFSPGKTRREHALGHIGLSGSLAGISLWASVLPLDVVKTRIQTDSLDKPNYKGISDAFRQIYKTRGLPGFFQGFAPCILRAIPVNGIVFMLYEVLYRALMESPKKMLI